MFALFRRSPNNKNEKKKKFKANFHRTLNYTVRNGHHIYYYYYWTRSCFTRRPVPFHSVRFRFDFEAK